MCLYFCWICKDIRLFALGGNASNLSFSSRKILWGGIQPKQEGLRSKNHSGRLFLLADRTTYALTRKRALHARMSHSTVCNTTVSTKKTLRTRVKWVRKLHVTPDARKGNAPVNMKEKYVSVQAIKRGHGYGCVSSSTNSPVDSYLCVCNGRAPGSPIRCAP